jgi:hypothetical protein
MKLDPIRPEVVAAIREVLQQEMRRFGLECVEVTVAPDHTEEPSLWIEARYGLQGDPIDPRAMARLTTKVRDQLWALGEERFPYIRHDIPEEKKVAELT